MAGVLGHNACGIAGHWLLHFFEARFDLFSRKFHVQLAFRDVEHDGIAVFNGRDRPPTDCLWRDVSGHLADDLSRAGMAARVLPPQHPDDGYRVVLGPFTSRAQAEATGRRLGRPFWIYQPGQ